MVNSFIINYIITKKKKGGKKKELNEKYSLMLVAPCIFYNTVVLAKFKILYCNQHWHSFTFWAKKLLR